MIHELEQKFGVWFAMGGTGALVKALGDLFMDTGGEIYTEAEAGEILIKDGKATGVKLKSGETFEADAVVSNADVAWTYLNLVPRGFRKNTRTRRLKDDLFDVAFRDLFRHG